MQLTDRWAFASSIPRIHSFLTHHIEYIGSFGALSNIGNVSNCASQTMSCAAGGYFWQLRKICLLCLIQVMWCYIPLLDLANETFIDILLDYLIGFCCECRQSFYCSNVEFMLFLYAYRIYYVFKLGGK